MFIPQPAMGLGLIILLGQQGIINDGLRLLHLPAGHFLYSPFAIILGHCLYNIPLAYLGLQQRFQTIGYGPEEHLGTLGANAWQQFWLGLWPRLRSSVVAISGLIGIYAFTSFSLPLMVGGAQFATVEVLIYRLITEHFNLELASWIAVMQWLVLVVTFSSIVARTKRYSEAKLPTIQQAGRQQRFIIGTLYISLLTLILSPLVSLLLQWHWPLTLPASFWHSLSNTLALALIVTGSVLGLGIIIITTKATIGVWLSIGLVCLSPVTLGLIWFRVLGQSWFSLGISLTVLLFPLIYFVLHNRWQAKPAQFNQIVQTLGGKGLSYQFAKLLWLFPTLPFVMALSVSAVLGDLSLAKLLTTSGHTTAMNLSFSWLSSYHFAQATQGMIVILGCIGLVSSVSLAVSKLNYAFNH
jgi:ABC-type Fe3+ transport system permease subunit